MPVRRFGWRGESPDEAIMAKTAPAIELSNLANLGPKSQAMLANAGIHSLSQLQTLGAVNAYLMVKRADARASLNLLWALAGALSGEHWQEVAKHRRLELLIALDDAQRHDDNH